MAGVFLSALFLLSCSFPARAQDTRSDQAGSVLREYVDKGYCTYSCVFPHGFREETCSPSGQTSTKAVTQEEMDGLKNQIDRLSSMVDALLLRVDSLSGQLSDEKAKNTDLTVNLTRTQLRLDTLTTTVYENGNAIRQAINSTEALEWQLTETKEETDSLKNQVDLLSEQLSEEQGKNSELTVNFTRARLQLDTLTTTVYENGNDIKQTNSSTEALKQQLTETKEETDGLKNQMDRLSSTMDSLYGQLSDEKGKNMELTVNLTRAVLRMAEGCSPPGFTGTEATMQQEMDRLKNQVARLSSTVDSLSGQLSDEKVKNKELTVNLTRALLQLDNLTTTVYENGNAIKNCSCDTPPQDDTLSTTQATSTTVEAGCVEYYASGITDSGVYTIGSLPNGVQAYCDMDTAGGGWIVIQRRQDGSVPFNRTWEEYKNGFGNKNGEYWIGNENIHLLTNQKTYSLRVDMEDWDNNRRYAQYTTFRVAGESDQYRLQISGYTGDAGHSMTAGDSNNGWGFTTVDRDNDPLSGDNCARRFGHGGWWFNHCSRAFLNGRYLGNCGSSCPTGQGVVWVLWRGYNYSLKSVSMKISPSL